MKVQTTRSQTLGNVRRVVLQVSRSVLTDPPVARVRTLAAEIAHLSEGGIDVVIVTSGAIGMGTIGLGLKRRPQQLPLFQAASAVGQVALIHAWDDALAAHHIPVAQVMMTREELDDRLRFMRLRHTLMALLDYGVVPVVNENQSVSADEFTTRGTDMLAASLPRLVDADLLVMLTSAEGIYGAPPSRGGGVITLVNDIEALEARVNEGVSQGRVQPMLASKVKAARLAAEDGVPTVVASGVRPGALANLLDDDTVGTLLLPRRTLRSRKQWIAVDHEPAGALRVDQAARRSLMEEGRSLLCSGVTAVEGDFQAGEAIRVLNPDGDEFARGLSGYSAAELQKIRGKDPAEIETILGYHLYDEAIRKSDLVIL